VVIRFFCRGGSQISPSCVRPAASRRDVKTWQSQAEQPHCCDVGCALAISWVEHDLGIFETKPLPVECGGMTPLFLQAWKAVLFFFNLPRISGCWSRIGLLGQVQQTPGIKYIQLDL